MDPIDALLSTLNSSNPNGTPLPNRLLQESSVPVTVSEIPAAESIDQLLNRLGTPQIQQVQGALLKHSPSAPPSSAPPSSAANSEITAYATQQAERAQVQQQLEQAEAQQQQALKEKRLQNLKQQRQQELRSQAQQWLDQLDPKSTEGRWFEEFGCNYDSRLEAAIAYISALQEVDHWLASGKQNSDEDG